VLTLALAESWLRIVHGDWLLIVQDRTIKKPYGWVFFYNSKKFLETRDNRDRIAGNAPIIVDRINGEIRVTGTARKIEHYLAEYEATIPSARLLLELPDDPLVEQRGS